MQPSLWKSCLARLEQELSEQQLNTWIRPLQALEEGDCLRLLAPNRFVLDWVRQHHLPNIRRALDKLCPERSIEVVLEIGSSRPAAPSPRPSPTLSLSSNPSLSVPVANTPPATKPSAAKSAAKASIPSVAETTPVQPLVAAEPTVLFNTEQRASNINPDYTFETFVEGKSNQLALAACRQVAQNPGTAYNPLFLYGGTGLGKTHLMHAVGNLLKSRQQNPKIVYQHAEQFVADMIKALQHNAINEFKRYYRSLDALLIDDIQFFAGKDRTQEEFFYTFNTLLEGRQQVILTCDRFPKEVNGLEERLKSRFGWGLTVAIEPPDLETRVAILMNKAEQARIAVPEEVAFFIAKRIRSNVRELEGALRRVYANSQFTGRTITLGFAKEALADLITLQDKLVTIENIQKTVADYYKIRVSDLSSSSRLRAIAQPRQVAMALAKELTGHSLPEIGDAFGGRDHTTVLYACRKVQELQQKDAKIRDDYTNLLITLSS